MAWPKGKPRKTADDAGFADDDLVQAEADVEDHVDDYLAPPASGRVVRAFNVVYHGTMQVFSAGQRVFFDAPLARYLAQQPNIPIEWDAP